MPRTYKCTKCGLFHGLSDKSIKLYKEKGKVYNKKCNSCKAADKKVRYDPKYDFEFTNEEINSGEYHNSVSIFGGIITDIKGTFADDVRYIGDVSIAVGEELDKMIRQKRESYIVSNMRFSNYNGVHLYAIRPREYSITFCKGIIYNCISKVLDQEFRNQFEGTDIYLSKDIWIEGGTGIIFVFGEDTARDIYSTMIMHHPQGSLESMIASISNSRMFDFIKDFSTTRSLDLEVGDYNLQIRGLRKYACVQLLLNAELNKRDITIDKLKLNADIISTAPTEKELLDKRPKPKVKTKASKSTAKVKTKASAPKVTSQEEYDAIAEEAEKKQTTGV